MQRSAFLAFIGAALLFSVGTAAAAGDITQGNEMNGLHVSKAMHSHYWAPLH